MVPQRAHSHKGAALTVSIFEANLFSPQSRWSSLLGRREHLQNEIARGRRHFTRVALRTCGRAKSKFISVAYFFSQAKSVLFMTLGWAMCEVLCSGVREVQQTSAMREGCTIRFRPFRRHVRDKRFPNSDLGHFQCDAGSTCQFRLQGRSRNQSFGDKTQSLSKGPI